MGSRAPQSPPLAAQLHVVDSLSNHLTLWLGGITGSASDQQSTNDRKVAGSRPTKVVCITVLTGNRMG